MSSLPITELDSVLSDEIRKVSCWKAMQRGEPLPAGVERQSTAAWIQSILLKEGTEYLTARKLQLVSGIKKP